MQHKGEYIWALLGRFVPMFIYLGTTMALARFLTPDDFGMVGVLSVFFMVAKTLMDAGLGGSLIKEKEISNLDCSTIFVFNIVVSLLLYFFIYLFAGTIENYFETPGLSKVVRVLCLVFIINSFGLVPWSLLVRYLKFRTITIINVVSVICAAIVSILMAIYKFGVYSLVSYQIVAAVVTVLLSIKASDFKVSFRFSLKSLHHLIPFGIFTTFSTIIDTIYENLITFLFGKYLNMQQAGYLSQAKRLEEVPSQSVAQTISNVAFPILTQLREDSDIFAKECTTTFKTVLLLVLPLLLVMCVFSEPIIHLVFGKQWIPAAPYLSLLVFAAVFHIAETLNRTFIKSTTQVRELFRYTLIKRAIGIAIIFAFLFIEPKLVLYGYIVSTFIGYLFNVHLLSRVSSLSFFSQIQLFLIILLPNAIYCIIMIIVNSLSLSLSIKIIIGAFLLIVYYLGALRLYQVNVITLISKLIKKRAIK